MFVLCAFSLCTLQLYRPYFVTAKCVLEEKLDVNKHAAKLHFSLALMGGELQKEEKLNLSPSLTVTWKFVPFYFSYVLMFNAGTNSCRTPLIDFSLASIIAIDGDVNSGLNEIIRCVLCCAM